MPELAVTTQTFCIALDFFSIRLLEQGCVATRLISSVQKFCCCHMELVDSYGVPICTMKTDLFDVSKFSFSLLSFIDKGTCNSCNPNQRRSFTEYFYCVI